MLHGAWVFEVGFGLKGERPVGDVAVGLFLSRAMQDLQLQEGSRIFMMMVA